MKAFSILVMMISLVLVMGCSEDSTTGPEDDGTYTLEDTETIGSAGGTVEIEDFSLTVPAGAFDADYELELYASSEGEPFGETQVTRTFRLEGLPDQYSQPLRVSIAYEGTLTEESFVARGEPAFDVVAGDSATIYRLHAATDSSGHLVCQLPASEGSAIALPHAPLRSPKDAHDLPEATELLGIDGHDPLTTEHFEIKYPVHLLEVNINDVASLLEDCYSTVVDDIRLSYVEPTWWSWPIETVVKRFPPRIDDCGAIMHHQDGKPIINVNQTMLSQGDFATVRGDIGLALLFLAMGTYDPFYKTDPDHFWLHLAVAGWSEEKFTDSPGYQSPKRFPGNEMAPFHGMRAGAEYSMSLARAHGYGMSAMIKYLVDSLGYGDHEGVEKSGLVLTYEAIRGGTDPTAALLDNVNALVAGWWPEFFRAYVGGGVYDVEATIFTKYSNLSGYWNVYDEDDTLEVFSSSEEGVGRYPDLSAKLFQIDLNYTTMDAASKMVLTVSGEVGTEPVTMIVFGVKDGPLEYWGHTTVQSEFFEIPGLRGYIDDGWRQLLVVVVNSDFDAWSPFPYTWKSDFDLTIRVTGAGQAPAYNRCHVAAAVYGHIERVWGEDTTDYYEHWTCATPFAYPEGVEGSFSGNTFAGSYDRGGSQGTVVINLDADQSVVTNVTWTEADTEGEITHQLELIGTNIPKIEPYLADLEYYVQGAETSGHIPALTHMSHYADSDLHYTLLGYDCNENSLLAVWLWEQ